MNKGTRDSHHPKPAAQSPRGGPAKSGARAADLTPECAAPPDAAIHDLPTQIVPPKPTGEQLAADLDAMTMLHRLAMLSVSEDNLETVLAEIVDVAIALSRADFGTIQLMDPVSGDLRIVAQRRLPQWWLDYWGNAGWGRGACGTALERGERIIIEDVERSPIYAGTPGLAIQLRAGVRAVQSTPLVSRSGKTLGMFSTHYKQPHRPDEQSLRLLDLLARQAADIIESVQSRAALRLSEERFKLALHGTREGVWDWDITTGQVHFADLFLEQLGFQQDELAPNYESWEKLIHHDDREQVLARLAEHLAGGTPYELTYRLRKKSGEYRWFLDRGEAIRDEAGRPVRMVGLLADITERKQAEQSLQESLLRFSTLFEKATLPTVLWRLPEGVMANVNNAFVEAFGYTKEEVVGKTSVDLGLTAAPEKCEGTASGIELALRTKSGEERVFLANLDILEMDGRQYVLSSYQDITERKQAEAALRESEERFRVMADGVPMIIWVTEPDGRIRFVNRYYCDYFGVTMEQLMSGGWQPLLHPDDVVTYVTDFMACQRDKRAFHNLTRVKRHDGEWRWMESFGQPRFSQTGEVLGMAGSSIDITERKAIEQERAEEARRKDEFLALLGHELRNPLAALSTAMQVLNGELPPELRTSLRDMMGRQVGLMRRMLDDLLDLGRITHGQINLRKEPVDLAECLQKVAGDQQSSISSCKQEMLLRLPGEPVQFMADKVRLDQILSNLLSNACKYTGQGGRIELSGNRENSEIVIQCKDNGRGIPLEMQKRIFDPFTRCEGISDSHGEASLGIGLTLAKRLVELHGGAISVASGGPGMGSAFVVRLPLVEASLAPSAPVEAAPAPFIRWPLSLVVVEDHPDVAQTLTIALEQAGHQVTVFATGTSALAGLSHMKPDAVLLDIKLPDMDGYELAAKLRQLPDFRRRLLIAVSGFRRRLGGDNFDHYFVKPVDSAELLAFLDARMHQADASAALTPASVPTEPLRVLLVEDHADLAALTAQMLRREGLEVRTALTGQEALKTAAAFRPQLTLCDLYLPDMKARDLVRELRSDPATEHGHVVILTALSAAEIRTFNRNAAQMGVDEFIPKPLTLNKLRSLLAKLPPELRSGTP